MSLKLRLIIGFQLKMAFNYPVIVENSFYLSFNNFYSKNGDILNSVDTNYFEVSEPIVLKCQIYVLTD